MKQLILLGLVFSSFYSNAEIIVTKKDRGIFGYKEVTEVQAEGRHTLTCLHPGRQACRPQIPSMVVDGTLTLTATEFNTIDATIERTVQDNEKEMGSFIFDNKAFVTYSYNPYQNTLIYTIYSITEAKNKNLI